MATTTVETWKSPFSKGVTVFFWICVGGVALSLVMMIVTGVQISRNRAAIQSAPVALPADGNATIAPAAPAGVPVPATP